jgi:hypothetical protein
MDRSHAAMTATGRSLALTVLIAARTDALTIGERIGLAIVRSGEYPQSDGQATTPRSATERSSRQAANGNIHQSNGASAPKLGSMTRHERHPKEHRMFDLTLARPADVAQREGNFNAAAGSTIDRERRAILLVACVTGLSVMSAASLLFADDTSTPWIVASAELATGVQRCDGSTNSSRHHECLREVAQAAARQASSPTVPARH